DHSSDIGLLIRKPDGPIARYVTGRLPSDETAPSVSSVGYLHPVYTPSGQLVTDCAPVDHRHHRGVFVGWVQMEGRKPADFWGWGAKAPIDGRRIVSRGAQGESTGPGRPVRFRAENAWMADDVELVTEQLQVRLHTTG